MFTQSERDTFLNAYIEAALWSSGDTILNVEHETLEGFTVAPETIEQARVSCNNFLAFNCELIRDALTVSGYDIGMAGHDYWLTRNGHGVGYWGRNLGSTGELLSKAAEACGTRDAYIGDDGFVYISK